MKIYLLSSLLVLSFGLSAMAQILPERRTVELDLDADEPGLKKTGTDAGELRPDAVTDVAGKAAADAAAAAKNKVAGALSGTKLGGIAGKAADAAGKAASSTKNAAQAAAAAAADSKVGQAASEFKAGLDGKLEVPATKFYLALKASSRTGVGPRDVTVQLTDRRSTQDYFVKIGGRVGDFEAIKFSRDRSVTLESDTHRVVLREGENLPPPRPTVDLRARAEAAAALRQQQEIEQRQRSLQVQGRAQQQTYSNRSAAPRRSVGDADGGFRNRRIRSGIGGAVTPGGSR